jgi:hypothetical protein
VSLIAGTTSAADLVSALAETTAFTTFLVVRTSGDETVAGTEPVWFGNFGGSGATLAGSALYCGAVGKDHFQWTYSNSGSPTTDSLQSAAAISHAAFRLIGMKTDGTTYTLSDYTNNVFLSKTGTSPRAIGTNPMLVGNYYNSTRQGPSDHAATFHYSVLLTTAEEAAQVAQTRTYMASLGITV